MNIPEIPPIPSYRFSVETARNGEPVPVIEIQGKRFFVGSRYDPSREADAFAANVDAADRDFLILLGGGDSALKAILKSPKKFRVAYVEPFRELLAGLSSADPRLEIFDGHDRLFEFIGTMGVEDFSRFRFVVPPSLKIPLRDYALWLSVSANAVFERRVSEIMTLAVVGETVVKNILSNLSHFSGLLPAKALFSAATEGIFCIAASGPSLDRSIAEIIRCRDRMRLIAVDSAVFPLLERGVVPDLGICLDPRQDEVEHIEAILPESRMKFPWVVSASIHPDVIRLLEHCKIYVFAGDHPLEVWLAGRLGDPGTLRTGGSVILPAFDLACRMGATDIVLAGADFSYGEGFLSHSRGAARLKKSLSTSNRLDTVEGRIYADAAERAPRRIKINRKSYRTGDNLLAYRGQLERRIKDFPGRCRHLMPTLGLDGAEACEALSHMDKTPIRQGSGTGRPVEYPWAGDGDLSGAVEEIRRRLSAEIAADPLFRSAVEAAVFRRVRRTKEETREVLPETAKQVAEELRKALKTSREER